MSNHDSTRSGCAVFWFRRDLRVDDNHALYAALNSGLPVLPLFIFDTDILNPLARDDRRVHFIHEQVSALHECFQAVGSGLQVEVGKPREVWERLLQRGDIKAVYFNEDYEPYARARDADVAAKAKAAGAQVHALKDQVIFSATQVLKDDGTPYKVYTPYSRRWLQTLTPSALSEFPSQKLLGKALQAKTKVPPTLGDLGFHQPSIPVPMGRTEPALLKAYAKTRDVMGVEGTSRLGPHLRFGTISVRQLVKLAQKTSETFLKELIWREFFMQILWHYPHIVDQPFDPRYKGLPWRNNAEEFERWRNGETGYPVVDAGMRELNATGFMHNRARMITGSFLCKHLLVDWRQGEREFAAKLMDFELASNVGNWQWVAGCGTDAAPYFRVFNPTLQAKKFDPKGEYIKRWVPEVGTSRYPQPMVDHEMARRRALVTYESHLKGAK